jgi:hypothetical protein
MAHVYSKLDLQSLPTLASMYGDGPISYIDCDSVMIKCLPVILFAINGMKANSVVAYMTEDSSVILREMNRTVRYDCELFFEKMRGGEIAVEIEVGSEIRATRNCWITINKKSPYTDSLEEMLFGYRELMREIRGDESALSLCRKAYNDWVDLPTQDHLEILKSRYETLNLRMMGLLCGFDHKDGPVRRALGIS